MDIIAYASSSKGNAYKVSDGATSLLIDCGLPFKTLQEKCGYKASAFDACLISHNHLDHSKGAKDLAKAGIDIYSSVGTIDACGLSGHRIHPVRALSTFTVGSFQVMPFDVQHDAPEPLGFLIQSNHTKERLVYITDTYYIKYRFDRLTHIMIEANYSEEGVMASIDRGYISPELAPRLIKSHMSLEHLLQFFRANDLSSLKKVYLIHLSENNSQEQLFKREVQKITGVEVYVC